MARSFPKTVNHVSIVKKLSMYIPHFTDVFDEESFYIFAFLFTAATIIAAVILARKTTLKDHGHVD